MFESIQAFNIYLNSVGGPIPDLSPWENLMLIDVEQNQFTGPAFPDNLSSNSELLAYRVSMNNLSGTIPASIAELESLKELWIAENAITGTIPGVVGELTNLGTSRRLCSWIMCFFVA